LKTILQLLIAALIVNAAARGGMATWRYYQFKDAATNEARLAGDETAAVVHQRILRVAEEQGIAILPADLEVAKEGTATTVAALYGEEIELIPRLYKREFLFDFEVSVQAVRPLTAEDFK
jgi:hypothetical protein